MNNRTIVIVVVAVLAVLVLAGFWRYRASGQADFSIHKLLRFSFKGSNRQEDSKAQHKGVNLGTGAIVQADEVIGGDKITAINVSALQPSAPTKSPRLKLSLFEFGHADAYHLGIKIAQGNAQHGNRYLIGLALENEEDDAPAKGIQITLNFYWDGAPPNRAIECQYSPQQGEEGWTTRVARISNEQPAVLVFSQPDLMCFSRQPQEWPGLAIATKEKLSGQIRIHYEVASLEPPSRDSGLLAIDLQ
jgi:hypothetical protein